MLKFSLIALFAMSMATLTIAASYLPVPEAALPAPVEVASAVTQVG
jgi:hypothetical protein